MTITYETVTLIIGIISLLGGVSAWYFASRLGERKENIEQSLEIKNMKDDIRELKIKCERLLILEGKMESFFKYK